MPSPSARAADFQERMRTDPAAVLGRSEELKSVPVKPVEIGKCESARRQ